MSIYEEKMSRFLKDHGVEAEHLVFEVSCHSVEEAARAVNACPEDLVKSVCIIDKQGDLLVAIVKGEDRVSIPKIADFLGSGSLRMARPQEILEKTGYECGGVPSFGFDATFLVDTRVVEKEFVYSGGGSQNSLIRITPAEMLRVNNGQVVEIRK